ncbi:MAG: Spy/CpxP family protein refolding chaperone [Elusimicrobia bacterium]|nr:Spy/CpxP family protein refolding chaperone [Elusimicrobiota bacterium]
MRTRHGRVAAAMRAAVIWLLAAGGAWAQPGTETTLPAALESRPLLECFLRNIGKWAELRKDLGLSRDQKQQFAEIFKSRKPEIKQAVRKLRAEWKKVLAVVRSDTPDETAIRTAIANMTGALADAAVLRSQIRRQAMTVLTSAQRGQVDKFFAEVQSSAEEAK